MGIFSWHAYMMSIGEYTSGHTRLGGDDYLCGMSKLGQERDDYRIVNMNNLILGVLGLGILQAQNGSLHKKGYVIDKLQSSVVVGYTRGSYDIDTRL